MRIPAPSPLSGSAPDAPRCSKLRSAVNALLTISCDCILLSVATIATPHASCSLAGSYRPTALGMAEKLDCDCNEISRSQ